MDIAKKPYEISLWDDRLIFVGESGEEYDDIAKAKEAITNQYFKEVRICTIGSDSMESLARCVNPKLTRKVNGENTLTFTMYYRYWDDDIQDFIYNPYNKYMVNERKVKLRIGPAVADENDESCKWYDFIIKNIQENSDTKAFTYTCKDQFVNELSKTGFELIFDNELENNMGTVTDLGARVLEGSDWKLGENSSNLKQYKQEPLYKVTLCKSITATDMLTETTTEIAAGEDIYVFYSIVNDKNPKWQFLYTDGDFVVDDDLVIDKDKHPNYEIDVEYNGYDWPDFVGKNISGDYLATLSTDYRGERLVRQVVTKYDATIDKFVGIYTKDGKEYYGFTESKYVSPSAVSNYVANPSNFTNTTGWNTDANQLDYQLRTYPEGFSENGAYQSFLYFQNKDNAWVMNAGIGGNRSTIGSFTEGEEYVLRIKYKNTLSSEYALTAPTAKISLYSIGTTYDEDNKGKYIFEKNEQGEEISLFSFFSINPPKTSDGKFGIYRETEDEIKKAEKTYYEKEDDEYIQTTDETFQEGKTYYEFYNEWVYEEPTDYIYMKASCSRSMSETDLSNWDIRIGLFLQFEDEEIFIEDVQVFPYETYTENGTTRLHVPGGKLFSEIKTKYIYYQPDQSWKSIKDLVPAYEGYEDDDGFVRVYNDNNSQFTKVRSISAKESNRFNLIQNLCETFECWPKFTVLRDQTTGKILYGTGEDAYRQQKFLTFHEYVGKPNYAGFRYGINSKSIQRTIDSAAIVSKMIVKDNANEFAPNGFCSIARATENPTGENFLLNFDHYARQRLLNFAIVTNDLYLDVNGYLGYYKKLKRLNADRDTKIDIQSGLVTDISNFNAAYTTYKTSYDAATEEQLVIVRNASTFVGKLNEAGKVINAENFATEVPLLLAEGAKYYNNNELTSYWVKWCRCQNIITQHKPLYEKAKLNLDSAQAQYDKIQAYLKDLEIQKRALNLQFYKKYSRFIQEGSWIKEDYTDPNLYYLDSESTLHTSAQPKITYNINVIDVSPLEEYSNYEFDIGDETYIEDIEFFGWSLIDGTTPYREKIVVSEIISELDSPEKNQIKVQNYKNQFEDLFQRITASTQQAEYHTGEYNRAASVVETNGLISIDTLQNSFANNALKLSNARDQSVIWNETGITTTSLTNPSEMVRIISGGIFLSTDGGQSWKTGITGSGINTSYLTSGQINTNEVYIMNGNNPAFRWDSIGLSAYDYTGGGYNTNKYVRFDEHGIYGVIGDDDWAPENIEIIHEKAKFALTWKGFSLKNQYGVGYVAINSEDDFIVSDGLDNRIKIGQLKAGNDGYYKANVSKGFVEGRDYYIKNIVETGEQVLEEYLKVDINETPEPIENVEYYQYKNGGTYGIRISDAEGATVMETDDGGNLWLKNQLHVETYNDDNSVEIGKLDAVRDPSNGGRIINANSEFVVYENGYVIAKNLKATGGEIGDIKISPNGLEVFNNNFTIYRETSDEKKEKVFYSDNQGNVILKGTVYAEAGSFSGTVNATDGSFSGSVNALSGSIGGLVLENGMLSSKDINDTLSINTNTGEIKAKNIILGQGATIESYINLGNASLNNPGENHEQPFISAGSNALQIFDDGTAHFGNIVIDGPNSKIYGEKFSITPEYANFQNINCSGSIETVVFKKNSVQAAGGVMIFRPSYKIEEIKEENDGSTIILTEEFKGSNGSTVWIAKDDSDYKEVIVKKLEDSKQLWTKDVKLGDKDVLLDLGIKDRYVLTEDLAPIEGKTYYNYSEGVYTEAENIPQFSLDENKILNGNFALDANFLVAAEGATFVLNNQVVGFDMSGYYELATLDNFIMGINAGNTPVGAAQELLGRGLTIREYGNKTPNLFLGDLQSIGKQGYGLYSDNVYLTGSLTTKSTSGLTAGVNTASGVEGLLDIVGTVSPIIFWAGAVGESKEAIQNAPFQVTESGHVYAKQIKLTESVFAGGEIVGTSIKAAKIYGTGEGQSALDIYDTAKGITFYNGESETFSIGSDGLKIDNNNFISIDAEKKVEFAGNFIGSFQTAQNGIEISQSDDENATYVKYNSATKIKINDSATEIHGIIKYANVEYREIDGGYDLYIV